MNTVLPHFARALWAWGAAGLICACGDAQPDEQLPASGGSNPSGGASGSGVSGGGSAGSAVAGSGGRAGAPTAGAASGGAPSSSGSGGAPTSAGAGTSGRGGTPASSGSGGSGGSGLPAIAGASSGGRAGSGGVTSGQAGAGGAASGKAGAGGMTNGGAGAGGSGNVPSVGPGPCGCEDPAGEFGTVDSTIIVKPGEVYDGQCKIYRANPSTLGDGDQGENQKPIFRLEDGASLRNVVIGASGADGIHLYGDVTLENIHWLDIGEDAMTVKESGTVRLNCGSATRGEDKVFQVNAASEIFISNFTASDAGKFMRQNGDTTFRVAVTIDHSDISAMDEVIFRTDSTSSHVTLTNSRYSRLGKGLFMFGDSVVNGNSNQSTVSNNMAY